MIDNICSLFSNPGWFETELDFKTENWNDRLKWCSEHFGRVGPGDRLDRKYRWAQQFNKIYFRDEKDYAWFLLRWA